jgi:hypothetical protein
MVSMPMQRLRALVAVAGAAVAASGAAACGVSLSGTATPDAGSDSSVQDASIDGPRFDGAGDDSSGVDAAPPMQGGYVNVTSWDYTDSNGQELGYVAAAAFYPHFASLSSWCARSRDGACTVYTCPATGTPDGGASESAGAITVSGGSTLVSLAPSGGVYAPVTVRSQSLWQGGELLTVTAQGARVPSFAIDVVAPSYVTVTSPSWAAAGAPMLVDRALPFAATWTGGGAGSVYLVVTATTATTTTSVVCIFPATDGAGAIPTADLAALPLSPTTASVAIESVDWTDTTASGWDVRVTLVATARSSTGAATAAAAIK